MKRMKGFVEQQFLFIFLEYEKRKNQYRLILPLFILKNDSKMRLIYKIKS